MLPNKGVGLNAVVRHKLLSLLIGQEIDLEPYGIPYVVQRQSVWVYRLAPHDREATYHRIRCKNPKTCIAKIAKALNLPVPE